MPVEEIQEAHQARRAQDQHRHRHPPGDDRRRSASTWPRTRRSSTRATTSSRRARRPRQICRERYLQFGCEGQAAKITAQPLTADRQALRAGRARADGASDARPPARQATSRAAASRARLRSLPLLARGKVRDNYAVGDDRLLMVASDRLSAFDVVMGEPIPGKGRAADADGAVLVRAPRRHRAEPPDRRRPARAWSRADERDAGARPLDAGQAAEAAAGRGGGARLPGRQRLEGVPGERRGLRRARCRRA